MISLFWLFHYYVWCFVLTIVLQISKKNVQECLPAELIINITKIPFILLIYYYSFSSSDKIFHKVTQPHSYLRQWLVNLKEIRTQTSIDSPYTLQILPMKLLFCRWVNNECMRMKFMWTFFSAVKLSNDKHRPPVS